MPSCTDHFLCSAIKKARKWRQDLGTTYNENILKLVYNAFATVLYKLSKQCQPRDSKYIALIVLDGTESWDQDVRTHCIQLSERVSELWCLGVFHWSECREIVLGSPLLSPPTMGKSKEAKKRARKARQARKQASKLPEKNPNAMSVQPRRRHDGQARAAEYKVYGGGAQRSQISNPSTTSDHAARDEDCTLMDVSPPQDDRSNDSTIVMDDTPECYGVDIFLAASKRDHRDHLRLSQKVSVMSGPGRSLLEVYEDHPDMRLCNMDMQVLELAGSSVKQVTLEATHEFLKKCIPDADRESVWAQVLGQSRPSPDSNSSEIASIFIPDGTLDLKSGRRPLDLLMDTCIHALSSSYSISDAKTLKLVFNRAIALCDALRDTKRRDALARALHALDWLVLGLEVKTTAIYRSINQELDKIEMRYPSRRDKEDWVEVSKKRQQAERGTLESHKLTYEGFKEPFRMGFVQTLQSLVSLKEA